MTQHLSHLHAAGADAAAHAEAGLAILRDALERGLLRELPTKPYITPGNRGAQVRAVRFIEDNRTSTTNGDAARTAGAPLDTEGNVCIDGTFPNIKKLTVLLGGTAQNKGKGKPLVIKLGNENLTDRALIRRRLNGERISMTAIERDSISAGSFDDADWLTPAEAGQDARAVAAEVEFCKHVRLNVFRYGADSRDSFQYHTLRALEVYRDMRRHHSIALSVAEYRATWYSMASQVEADEEDPQDKESSGFTYPQRQFDVDQLDLPIAHNIQPKGAAYTGTPIYCDNPHSRAEFCPITLHEPWLTETLRLPAGVAEWRKAAGSEYGQRELAAAIMAGSVVAQLPTGFGKSLPVQSVIAAEAGNGSTTIVVLPTNALKQEWLDSIRTAYPDVLAAQLCNAERSHNGERIAALLSGQLDVLFISPEHLMPNHTCCIALMQLALAGKLTRIVFDEAHLLTDWRSFRVANDGLLRTLAESAFDYVPRVLLSATMTGEQRIDICRMLCAPTDTVTFTADVRRENIALQTQQQLPNNCQALSQMLRRFELQGRKVLAFVDRIKAMPSMLRELRRNNPDIQVREYHSRLTPEQKLGVLEWYRETDSAVLLATTALSVGVNLPGLDAVILTYIPNKLNELVQLIGRAGRDGLGANAVLLYNAAELEACRAEQPSIARLYTNNLTSAEIWKRIAASY